MFQTRVAEKFKTDILCSIFFSRKACCLKANVENNVELNRSELPIIQRIQEVITKARTQTRTHNTVFNTYCFYTATMVT
jgi:hypothetical protein